MKPQSEIYIERAESAMKMAEHYRQAGWDAMADGCVEYAADLAMKAIYASMIEQPECPCCADDRRCTCNPVTTNDEFSD